MARRLGSRSQRRAPIVAAVLTVVISQGPAAQAPTPQMTAETIRARMSAAAQSMDPLSAGDAAVVVEALSHANEQVRTDALGVLEARLSPFVASYRSAGAYASDARLLAPAEPHVWALLDAADARVRRRALRAMVMLRVSRSPDGIAAIAAAGYDPGQDLVDRAALMFEKDADAGVRVASVQLLSGVGANVPDATTRVVHRVLMKALNDPSWGVVNVAVRDAARRRIPGSLAESARLLQHKDYQVRMVAAQALASFGRDARPHLPELRRAADIETHDITKKTMVGSITVIER